MIIYQLNTTKRDIINYAVKQDVLYLCTSLHLSLHQNANLISFVHFLETLNFY